MEQRGKATKSAPGRLRSFVLAAIILAAARSVFMALVNKERIAVGRPSGVDLAALCWVGHDSGPELWRAFLR